MARLQSMMTAKGMGNINPQDPSTMSGLKLTIGRRSNDGAANDRFEPMPLMAAGNGNAGNANNMQMQLVDGRLQFQGITKLDGEYVILIPMAPGLVEGGKQELGLKKTSPAPKLSVQWGTFLAMVTVFGGMMAL